MYSICSLVDGTVAISERYVRKMAISVHMVATRGEASVSHTCRFITVLAYLPNYTYVHAYDMAAVVYRE